MRLANAVLAAAVVVFPLAGCNAILGLDSFTNCEGGDTGNCASGGAGPGSSSSSASTGGASSSTSSSSSSSGNGGNGGGGGPTACVPNMSVDCYTGMNGTENTGVCHGGMKTCNAEGIAYGDCTGEVTPLTEDCSVTGNEACTGPYGCSDIKWATFGQGASSGSAITIDHDGNVITLGSYSKMETWGTFNLSGGGNTLVKMTPAGDVTFANSYCGLLITLGADQQGNIFMSGLLNSSCAFGGQTLSATSYPALLVARVNADGTLGWAQAFAGATFLSQIAVDSNGDAIVSGVINNSITFGSTKLTGALALYLAKLSGATGQPIWAKSFQATGTGASARSYSIALDSSNDILLGGSFGGTLSFGGTASALPSQGTQDGYIAKLDPTGAGVWAKNFTLNPSSSMATTSIAVDSQDNVLLSGLFTGGIRVDSFQVVTTATTATNAVVAKLSSEGNATWAKGFGDASTVDISLSVKATANDAVAIGGSFDSTIQFGNASTQLQSNGSGDAVLAELDAGGVYRWSKHFGDAGQQGLGGIAYDKTSQSIAINGSMSAGAIDLGTGTTSAPNGAGFVAEFQP